MSDEKKVIKGQFREPRPDSSATLSLDLLQEVEQRADGPWLVVYAFGKKVGEVPIEPGTEPRIRRAKVLNFSPREPKDDARDDAGGDRGKSSRPDDPDGD